MSDGRWPMAPMAPNRHLLQEMPRPFITCIAISSLLHLNTSFQQTLSVVICIINCLYHDFPKRRNVHTPRHYHIGRFPTLFPHITYGLACTQLQWSIDGTRSICGRMNKPIYHLILKSILKYIPCSPRKSMSCNYGLQTIQIF